MAAFADVWQAADKTVYSSTLEAGSTGRTLVERRFDPDRIREMKAVRRQPTSPSGVRHSRRQAFDAGLIDECQLFVYPVARRIRQARVRGRRPGPIWTCWTSTGSAMASCTCATASWADRSVGSAAVPPSRRPDPGSSATAGRRGTAGDGQASTPATRRRPGRTPGLRQAMMRRLQRCRTWPRARTTGRRSRRRSGIGGDRRSPMPRTGPPGWLHRGRSEETVAHAWHMGRR